MDHLHAPPGSRMCDYRVRANRIERREIWQRSLRAMNETMITYVFQSYKIIGSLIESNACRRFCLYDCLLLPKCQAELGTTAENYLLLYANHNSGNNTTTMVITRIVTFN